MDIKDHITEIKKASDFNTVAILLRDLDRDELLARHVTAVARKIGQLRDVPDVKIAYLSNFTIDLLPSFVNVNAAIEGILSDSYIGAYNQYFQEILSHDSPLVDYRPDIIFLALSMKQLEPEIFCSFLSLTDKDKEERIERILSLYERWLSAASKRFRATILVGNFQTPSFTQGGISDVNTIFSEIFFYHEVNRSIGELVSTRPNVHIVDIAKLSARFGLNNAYDPKMYYMAKMFWSENFLAVVAEELVRYLIALKGLTRKCLVLDLDNTLWGGVLGEDGPHGVKIGMGDPVSEAYLDFQHKIKSLKDRGIILGICSKNNQEDVLEAFEKRTEMPLKISDFASTHINWDNKHVNIQRIAKELNIGLESMVFMDDNPAECSLIRQMLPQVKTIQVPPDPEDMPALIDKLVDFEKITILEDDLRKAEQYHQIKQRKELQESMGDLRTYLESLGTEITIRRATRGDLNRIHQLYTKTNQFNVTTIRYDMGEIERQLAEECYNLFVISARDTFGELGIIGLYLIELSPPKAKVDSFVLSCRAMGRDIETAIMNHLKDWYVKNREIELIEARYSPTEKNVPVQNFFTEQGFEVIQEKEDGEKSYQLSKEGCSLLDCSWIKVIEA